MVTRSSPTRASQITTRLRMDIVGCVLKPGEKLTFAPLSERYGVSMSTLRESLMALVAEGLVGTDNRRGFWVSPVSREDFVDLSDTRCIVTTEALRRAMANRTDEWEGSLLRALHVLKQAKRPTDLARVLENQQRHSEFHALLIEPCRSPRLLVLSANLGYQFTRYRQIFPEVISPPPNMVTSHTEIVDTVLKRDAARACAMLRRHIEDGARSVLKLMDSTDWEKRVRAAGARKTARVRK